MLKPEAIIDKKQKYFFPNAMHFYKNPPHITKGEGQYLFDEEGQRYTDFFAGVTVANCGHCNSQINKKVHQQIDTLQHTSIIYLTEPMVNLAERLSDLLPGDISKTFFCCSGTEANEGALLLARMHTGKKGFIAFEGGLHGRSALTMSVTGIPMWRIDPFLDPDVYFATGFMANSERREEASEISLKSVDRILSEHGHEIAGCIVEPIQGNGGIHIPQKDFFVKLKALLDPYGILLIVDEVQTAFARTGKYFAIEHFNVVPDIITMAKALGNGVPIGAFSARPQIAKSFNKPSASTLGGNPVSTTAGLAVLDYIKDHQLCEKSMQLGVYLISALTLLKNKHAIVQDVRGLGLMIGMSLQTAEQIDFVLEEMKNKGFIIGKNGVNRDVLAFQPPLVITISDIDEMIKALDQILSTLEI